MYLQECIKALKILFKTIVLFFLLFFVNLILQLIYRYLLLDSFDSQLFLKSFYVAFSLKNGITFFHFFYPLLLFFILYNLYTNMPFYSKDFYLLLLVRLFFLLSMVVGLLYLFWFSNHLKLIKRNWHKPQEHLEWSLLNTSFLKDSKVKKNYFLTLKLKKPKKLPYINEILKLRYKNWKFILMVLGYLYGVGIILNFLRRMVPFFFSNLNELLLVIFFILCIFVYY